MSVGYTWIQWNRHKKVYDLAAVGLVLLYVAGFVVVGKLAYRGAESISDEILVMRALGSCAFLMLHVVLCIGPLARFDRRLLPLLYNRRHLGVMTFLVAFGHGAIALGYYHGFGIVNPFVSLLESNTNFTSLTAFPFQTLGAAALAILFLMAATSHDFWLRNLGAAAWKRMHMLVYVAYGLLVAHVALGALQSQRHPLLAVALLSGVLTVGVLHIAAGRRERARGIRRSGPQTASPGAWLDMAAVRDVPEGRGLTVCPGRGERIALFRHDGAISAITNVCAHQGGPLGEGRIIDGCVTCPWHGWQYRPADGQSPPPFTEKIATYQVRIEGDRVLVNTAALPPGTPVPPARCEELRHA